MKNKDYVQKAFDKINARKKLYDEKKEIINEKITFLEEYIKENDDKIEKEVINDGFTSLLKVEMWAYYGLAFFSVPFLAKEDKLLFSILCFLSGEVIQNIITSTYESSRSLIELDRKYRHLTKEKKKAEKTIYKLYKKLGVFKRGYEESSYKDVQRLFSDEGLNYHDKDEQHQNDYSKIMTNNKC